MSVVIEPVYQTERATLYHGDALEVLAHIPRACIDLLVTDPPYGIKYRSGFSRKFDQLIGDDGSLDVPALLGAYAGRVFGTQGEIYVFGYSPSDLIKPLRLTAHAELIWDKGALGMGNLDIPWALQHEVITFGVRGARKTAGISSARKRAGSVIRVNRPTGNKSAARHPTEKPVKLLRQLIESSSAIGDTVLDPFAGSGSTLVAAVLLGRKAVGIEIDERYINVAIERMEYAERLAKEIDAA